MNRCNWRPLVAIPHICHFWYATIFFGLAKSMPKKCVLFSFFIGLAVLGNCWHPHIELRFTYCRYITVDLHVSFFYNGSSLLLAAALYTYNHITNSSSGFFWLWILLSLPKLLNLQRRWPFGGVPASQVYQRNLILSDLPRKEAD